MVAVVPAAASAGLPTATREAADARARARVVRDRFIEVSKDASRMSYDG